MLTPEQAGLLGEWRCRQQWPVLTRLDKYRNILQMKYRAWKPDFARQISKSLDQFWEAPPT